MAFATNPAVAYPCWLKYSARVGYRSSSGRSVPTASSRTHRPVNMLACDGSVQDDVETARSKRAPRDAIARRYGVVSRPRFCWRRLVASSRTVSITIITTLGALEGGGPVIGSRFMVSRTRTTPSTIAGMASRTGSVRFTHTPKKGPRARSAGPTRPPRRSRATRTTGRSTPGSPAAETARRCSHRRTTSPIDRSGESCRSTTQPGTPRSGTIQSSRPAPSRRGEDFAAKDHAGTRTLRTSTTPSSTQPGHRSAPDAPYHQSPRWRRSRSRTRTAPTRILGTLSDDTSEIITLKRGVSSSGSGRVGVGPRPGAFEGQRRR